MKFSNAQRSTLNAQRSIQRVGRRTFAFLWLVCAATVLAGDNSYLFNFVGEIGEAAARCIVPCIGGARSQNRQCGMGQLERPSSIAHSRQVALLVVPSMS